MTKYRGSKGALGFKVEGIPVTGTDPKTYQFLQTNADIGALTSYAASVLTNSNASWLTNTWKGARVFVYPTGKTSSKGFARIISNTSTTLTVGIESGSDLDTTANSPVVTSTGSTFQSLGIRSGDIFYISSGSDTGVYIIHSVDSETQLTLSSLMTTTDTVDFQTNFTSLPAATDIYEVDTFGMTSVEGAQVNDVGLTFNSQVDLPDPEIEYVIDYAIGLNREPDIFTRGKLTMHSTPVGRLRVPRWLSMALGKEVVTGSSAPYMHVLSVADKLPSFVFEGAFDNSVDFVRTYESCRINTLKISGSAGEPMNMEAELFCYRTHDDFDVQSVIVQDSNSGNYKPEEPYRLSKGAFTYFNFPYACLESYELSINNNLNEDYCLNADGDALPESTEDKVEYELSGTIRPTNKQVWRELIYESAGGGIADLAFTRTPSFDYMNIKASGCRQISAPHPMPEGILKVDFTVIPQSVVITTLDNFSTYWV